MTSDARSKPSFGGAPRLSTSGKERSPSSLPTSSHSSTSKKRTGHACDRCRLMRTKCSGGTRCVRCTKDDAVCIYGDHKRERNKKDLAESTDRIKELEHDNRVLVLALRQLTTSPYSISPGHTVLTNVMSKYTEDEQAESAYESSSQSRSVRSQTTPVKTQAIRGGELMVPSTVGSPGRQGELHRMVELDNGVGAAGLVGKMSEISWMQRCREHLLNQTDSDTMGVELPEMDVHTVAAEDLAYFTDDLNLLAVDEDHINAAQWPTFKVAIIMTEAYCQAMQGVFEFFIHETFLESLHNFPRYDAQLDFPQRRWLSIANLVWAIGSKWLHLAKLDLTTGPDDHLVYYARARALGLDHRILFDHPDVDMVQGIGLLALYLLINGSITRAWNIIGNAIRHAMTLGLHLKIVNPSISRSEHVRRSRLWFSLYKLQMLMVEITGRPQQLRNAHVTIPLDDLEQPSSDVSNSETTFSSSKLVLDAREIWMQFLHERDAGENLDFVQLVPHESFLHHVRLCQLSDEVADQLYTGRHDMPWSETQVRIENLQKALDAWMATSSNVLELNEDWQLQSRSRAYIQLSMYACSVSMMIHRLCLCEIRIENESGASKSFNVWSARTCVKSALSMLRLLPDNIVPGRMYYTLPWWTLLHYLCQAIAVLTLELCLRAQHYQGDIAQIIHAINKAMTYLTYMTEESKSAYKAWKIFSKLLQIVSIGYENHNMFDLDQDITQPRWWTQEEEAALLAIL